MRKRWLAFPVVAFTAGLIALFGVSLQRELAPIEDKSRIRLSSTAPEGTSYEAMDAYQQQLMMMMDTLSEKKFHDGYRLHSGEVHLLLQTRAFVRISLLPPSERKRQPDGNRTQQLRPIGKKIQFCTNIGCAGTNH